MEKKKKKNGDCLRLSTFLFENSIYSQELVKIYLSSLYLNWFFYSYENSFSKPTSKTFDI